VLCRPTTICELRAPPALSSDQPPHAGRAGTGLLGTWSSLSKLPCIYRGNYVTLAYIPVRIAASSSCNTSCARLVSSQTNLCVWHAPHGSAHGQHIVRTECVAVPLRAQVMAQRHVTIHMVRARLQHLATVCEFLGAHVSCPRKPTAARAMGRFPF
jgi:hypothetical protein